MALTNVQIIGDALRLIGIIAETETPSAEQGEVGLRKLNQMMEAWEEEGVRLGYFAQSSTTDTCPIPAWAEKAVTGMLAVDLVTAFPGAEIGPAQAKSIDDGYQAMLRKFTQPEHADMRGLSGSRYDITTDTGG